MSSVTVCKNLLRNLPTVGLQFRSQKRPTWQEFEAWRQMLIAEAPRLHPDQTLGSRVAMVSLAWRVHHHGQPSDSTHVDVALVRRPWRSLQSLATLAEVAAALVGRVAREHAWAGLLCEAVHTLETLAEELPKCPVSKWRLLFGARAGYEPYLWLMGQLEALQDDMALHPGAVVDALLDYDSYRDLRHRLEEFFQQFFEKQ